MIIKLSPQVKDDTLSIERQGQKLIVNGVEFDFTNLPEGCTLPASAINSDSFIGNIERLDGTLHITLLYPIASTEKRRSVCYPEPIHVTMNGKVVLPHEQ